MANLLIFDAHYCPKGYEVRAVLQSDVDLACVDGLVPWKLTGLVTHTYLSGGVYFTMGAYLGWFNVRARTNRDTLRARPASSHATLPSSCHAQ